MNDADAITAKHPVSPKVAWQVEIHEMNCIVFAETAPKARWIAVKSFREAGYGSDGYWPRPKAWRVPQHDDSLLRDRPPQAWSPDYVAGYPFQAKRKGLRRRVVIANL